MATLPGLIKGVTKDPTPPATDTVVSPISIPDGTTLVTTKTTNETIDNVDALIDYVSGDNVSNFIPQLAIDNLVSDLAAKENSLGFTPENIANKVITIGTPGDDTNYPTEKAVRDGLGLKEDSLGFTPENIANKGAMSGYAGLDGSQELLLANFPSGNALDVLRRNATNDALEFAVIAGGGEFTGAWTANHNEGGSIFSLEDARFADPTDDSKTIQMNLAGMTTGIELTISTNQTTAQTLTIPNIAAAATIIVTGLADQITDTELTAGRFASITGVGNQFNLLTDDITAVLELEANHTTPTTQTIGQIDFYDDNSIGTRIKYAAMEVAIVDATSTTEDGTLKIKLVTAGIFTNYMLFNDSSSGVIAILKDMNFFTNDIISLGTLNTHTIPAGTSTFAMLGLTNVFTGAIQITAGTMRIPLSATPTMAVDGDFAIDTLVTDFSHGIIKYFDGEILGVVSMPIGEFTTPVDGNVIAYNATNDEFELVAGGGGVGDVVGPGSATNDAVTLFDSTTGKLIKNSNLIYQTSTNQLQIPGAVVFTADGTVPAGTNTYIREDTGDMDINVADGQSIFLQWGAAQRYTFTSTTLSMSGNTISSAVFAGVLSGSTITAVGGITYSSGIKQTFSPSNTNAGINVGQNASNPTTPVNGDIFYESTANELIARINGAWVSLGAGGGGEFNGPYTADVDWDRYDIDNMGVIKFTNVARVDALAGDWAIWVDDAPVPDTMKINVPTNMETALSFNGVIEYTWSATQMDLLGKQLINVAFITLESATLPVLRFNRTAAAVGTGNAGHVEFRSGNQIYGEIRVDPTNVTASDETGTMVLRVASNSIESDMITLTGNLAGASSSTISFNNRLMASQINMNSNVIQNIGDWRSDNTPIAGAGLGKMGNEDYLAWRNAGDSTDNGITFNSSDQFEISIGSITSADYTFSSTVFDMLGRRIAQLLHIQDASANEQLAFASVASAENHIQITNAADGDGPIIAAIGDDADVDLNIRAKAEGSIIFADNDGNEELLTLVQISGAATNHVEIVNSLVSNGPTIASQGETDVDLNITAKGTGVTNLLADVLIGESATDLLGFYGTTIIAQPTHVVDPTGGATVDAEARTAIDSILAQLASLGLQASS